MAVLRKKIRFGQLAEKEGFVTRSQVQASLTIQEKIQSLKKKHARLAKIMVKKGYLTRMEAKFLLRLQRSESPIPGYKLIRRVGRGGMGVVYKAEQESLKRVVALKILSPRFSKNPRFRSRFSREARLTGQLSHPNIIRSYDAGEENGLFYHAMEYVSGPSVRRIMKKRGRIEERIALRIARQMASALVETEAHQIIHRDIKPDNILITRQGIAKLTDLGLSKQLSSDCFLTREGKTLGTPYYLSPELARGMSDIDVRSDIYSLGATLYHMVVGEVPFTGEAAADIMARHVTEAVEPPMERCPDLSPETSDLICRMMERRREKRFQSAEELLEAVKKALRAVKRRGRKEAAETDIASEDETDSVDETVEAEESRNEAPRKRNRKRKRKRGRISSRRSRLRNRGERPTLSDDLSAIEEEEGEEEPRAVRDAKSKTKRQRRKRSTAERKALGTKGWKKAKKAATRRRRRRRDEKAEERPDSGERPALAKRRRIHPAVWIGGGVALFLLVGTALFFLLGDDGSGGGAGLASAGDPLAEVETFRKENPTRFATLIARYEKLAEEHPDRAEEIENEIRRLKGKRNYMAPLEFEKTVKEANELAMNGNVAGGIAKLEAFMKEFAGTEHAEEAKLIKQDFEAASETAEAE